MARQGSVLSRLMDVRAFLVILLFLGLGCLQISDGHSYAEAEGDTAEEREKIDTGAFSHLTWGRDSQTLYFIGRLERDEKNQIMKYDLSSNGTEVFGVSPNIAFMTINKCGDIFASTHKEPRGDFCIISAEGIRYHDLEEIDTMIYPAWLANCSEVVFHGCGSDFCGVFLWNKESDSLRLITPFENSSMNGIRIHYAYDRFAPSFVPKRIVFGYHELRVREGTLTSTLNLGSLDLETGKGWKIVELEDDYETFRWHSSDTEDAVCFFKWNEESRLDSLWKVKSDGTGLSKVMDGKQIGQVNSRSIVSWSRGGKRFAIQYRSYGNRENRIDVVDTVTGQARNLGLIDATSFALSPDGTKLAFITWGNEVHLLDVESNTDEMIFPAR